MLLRGLGYPVRDERDTDAAREALRDASPRLVVFGRLREANEGDAFLRELCAQPDGASIPLVVLGAPQEGPALDCDCATVFAAPVHLDGVLDAVKRLWVDGVQRPSCA